MRVKVKLSRKLFVMKARNSDKVSNLDNHKVMISQLTL